MKTINRRAFQKIVGQAGLAAILSNSVFPNGGFHAAGSDILKFGLVGCGGRGTGAARQFLNNPQTRIVAMADLFANKLEQSAQLIQRLSKEQFDVPKSRQFVGFDGYQRVIQSDVDAVIHATPPGFRPQHTEEIVDAGKHCFIEKPVATDSFGVRQMLQAAETAKLKRLSVVVGFHSRFDTRTEEAIAFIHSGKIGRIKKMNANWKTRGIWVRERQPGWSELEYQLNNWYYFTWLSGESIVEQNSQMIDLCLWAANERPVSAIGRCSRDVRIGYCHGQIQDEFDIDYRFASGAEMNAISLQQPDNKNMIVEALISGEHGECELSRGTLVVDGRTSKLYTPSNFVNGFQQEQNIFFESIINGRPVNNIQSSADSTLAAIMGRMAAFQRRRVTWDEALNADERLVPVIKNWNQQPPTLPDKFGDYRLGTQSS